MKTTRFLAFLTGVVVIGACDKAGDGATLAPQPPMAYARFVNAVADTGPTDWRFIDQLEYSPIGLGLRFRDFSPYQQTAPGQRHLRVFPTSTDINVTQQFFVDTVLSLAAGHHYTIVHVGYSRAAQAPVDHLIVFDDDIPTVAAANVGTRVVNLGIGLGAIDVFATDTTTATLPAAPLFANVAFEGKSNYFVTQPVGGLAFRVANTGTTTLLASAMAPTGAAADAFNNLTAIAGSRVEKSIFTGFFFPRSVAGSAAPQTTAFTAPAVVYIADKHPQ